MSVALTNVSDSPEVLKSFCCDINWCHRSQCEAKTSTHLRSHTDKFSKIFHFSYLRVNNNNNNKTKIKIVVRVKSFVHFSSTSSPFVLWSVFNAFLFTPIQCFRIQFTAINIFSVKNLHFWCRCKRVITFVRSRSRNNLSKLHIHFAGERARHSLISTYNKYRCYSSLRQFSQFMVGSICASFARTLNAQRENSKEFLSSSPSTQHTSPSCKWKFKIILDDPEPLQRERSTELRRKRWNGKVSRMSCFNKNNCIPRNALDK